MYLRNAWYAAALTSEVDRSPKGFRILGEDIVIYRTLDGAAAALEDACPHRKLPLSKGFVDGDCIECGYHGLTFDRTGKCVRSPTQERIPPTAVVRSYPVVDRWGFLWIWMGETESAPDQSLIPAIERFDDPTWGATEPESLVCNCNYLYLVDNLLDPSHVAWVHRESLATEGTEDTPLETSFDDSGLVVSRWVYNEGAPAFYAPLLSFSGTCDRLQHYEARFPSVAINKSVFSPAGSGGADQPLSPHSYAAISYNFLTPIDQDTTRYFWLQVRNSSPDDEMLSQKIAEGLRTVFHEDKEVLEAVHEGMKNMKSPNINLGLDAAAVSFRQRLEKLIINEQTERRA